MTMRYLEYPKRAYGNDHDLYPWSYSAQREPVRLDDGTKLDAFIVVPLEFFPLNPSGKPFKHPGAMVTPYPDLRHYTTRDYGLRVGVFRILSFALGSESGLSRQCCCQIGQSLLRPYWLMAMKSQPMASQPTIFTMLASAKRMKRRTSSGQALFEKHGLSPKVWMSPAQWIYNTPELLAKHGFTTLLDWEMDQRPVEMKPLPGLTCLPNHFELNDFNLLITKRQSEDEWEAEITEAARYLLTEYDCWILVFGFTDALCFRTTFPHPCTKRYT